MEKTNIKGRHQKKGWTYQSVIDTFCLQLTGGFFALHWGFFPFLHSCLHLTSSKLLFIFGITLSFRANLKFLFIAWQLVCNTQQLLLEIQLTALPDPLVPQQPCIPYSRLSDNGMWHDLHVQNWEFIVNLFITTVQ